MPSNVNVLRTHRFVIAELGNISEETLLLAQSVKWDKIRKIMQTKFYLKETAKIELDELENKKSHAIIDIIDGYGSVIVSYIFEGLRPQRMALALDYTKSDILLYEIDFTFSKIKQI